MVGVGEGGPCLNIPTSVATTEPLSRLYFQLQGITPDRTTRHVLISPKRATILRSLVCPYVSIKSVVTSHYAIEPDRWGLATMTYPRLG